MTTAKNQRPPLLVIDAGYGKTPVPADALLQPGDVLAVQVAKEGGGFEPHDAKVLAVVPAGAIVEYAIADQNGQPRPLTLAVRDPFETTVYVIAAEEGRLVPLPQAVVSAGLARAKELEESGDLT